MRISFDTSTDSKLDMLAGIAALQAYMATYHGEAPVTGAHPQRRDTDHRPVCDVGQFAQPVRMTSDVKCPVVIQDPAAPILTQHDPATPSVTAAQVLPAGDKLGFTPGVLGAPSVADAAPSPTVPVVPTAGVPMPPSVAPVPAAPPTAPEAPAAPSTSAATGDLDVTGLPWDKRIHAGTKAKNADGSWRKMRGLNDAALVARVEAELRARYAPPPAPAATLADIPVPPTGAAVPPPPVTTVAAPPAPAAPDALTYDGFLAWVTPKMMDGSTPFDKVAAALSASGVSSLQELRDNPAAIPSVYAALSGE